MATKKTASKTSKKAESGISFNVSSNASKKTSKTGKKVVKSLGAKSLLLAFVFVLFGALLGAGTWWFVCKNDCFEIVGSDNISCELGTSYEDKGVKIVAFGKDETDSVSVDTNLIIDSEGHFKANEEGTYYIKYTSSCIKYGKIFKVEKVRLVTFVEASEGGE